MIRKGKKRCFWEKIVFLAIATIATSAAFLFLYSLETAANSPQAPNVEILKSDIEGTTLRIDVYGIQEKNIEINGQTFQILTLPGYEYTSEISKPQMPVIRETIGIPDNAKVTLNILNTSYSTFSGYKVHPLQPPEIDQYNDDEFVINEDFYSQDVFYPERLVELDVMGTWRDLNVIGLQVNPVTFNPTTGKLRVYNHILVELQYCGGIANEKVVPPLFAHMYESIILNYGYLNVVEAAPAMHESSGYKYLAIANPFFVDEIQPLVDWHDSTGMKAFLVDTTVTGTTAAQIKTYISNFYAANPDLIYVLLVGDIADVPWYTNWGIAGSDYWYGCIIGEDLYPELAVGRLTATNGFEVTQQVNKILKYEKHPTIIDDLKNGERTPADNWVEKVLLIAHREGAPGKYEECKEEIRTAEYIDSFIFETAYGSKWVTNTNVNCKINEGIGIINYRGHGSTTCWFDWTNALHRSYCTSQVYALANNNKTPVIFSIACYNAQLSAVNETLSEAFMKAEDGAVAFLGASEPSWTRPNHKFDKWLFDGIGNIGIYPIGWISNYANTQIINFYGESHYYMENVKMYLWLGDPALEIWTSAPATMNVTYPGSVSQEMKVTVTDDGRPIEGALICVTKSDLYITGITDSTGVVTLSLPSTTPGTASVTVTKHNYLAWEGSVEINHAVPIITCNLEKPRLYLYVFGKEILPLLRDKAMIIGDICLCANAYGVGGLERIEFYVDDELKETVTKGPFEWVWDERIIGKHTIKAIAYDTARNTATDEQEIWIFNI